MKTRILLFSVILLLSVGAYAQKLSSDKVPPAAAKALKVKFPKAEKISWEKEGEDNFEADFKLNGKEHSATFDKTGKWLQTEYEIKISDLPQEIQKAIKSEFAGFKIEEAEKVEALGNKIFYEVEIRKGKEKYELTYTPTGELLKKLDIAEDDDK